MKKLVYGLAVLLLMGIGLGLGFGHRDRTVAELRPHYATGASAFVAIDGMDVHYRDEGDPTDSLPLVLIHGTGASLHTFDAWAAALTPERRVVRMDLPGFGLTGPFPDGEYSIANYVSFIDAFLTARGIERCILGGNSLGGQIAWRYAAAHPTRVDRLVLIDAAGYPTEATSEPLAFTIARIPVLNRILTWLTPRSVIRKSVENVYADPTLVPDSLVDRYFDLTLRAGNRRAFVDRMQVRSDTTPVAQIPNLQQPTLVLWGSEDRLIPPANAYRFHAELPNSSLAILDGAGHVPMEESPARSLAVLRDFLDRTANRPAPGTEAIMWTAAWSPAGQRIATGGDYGQLLLFAEEDFSLRKSYPIPNTITQLAWHPTQPNVLAIATQNSPDRPSLFDVVTGQRTELDSIEASGARAIAWSTDGTYLAVGDYGGRVSFYTPAGKWLRSIPVDPKAVIGLSWHPRLNRLVAVGSQIGIYDLDTDSLQTIRPRPEVVLMLSAAWHPSGEFFVTGDYGDYEKDYPALLQFWRADGTKMRDVRGSTAEYRRLAWSPDGKELASTSDALRIWSPSGELLRAGASDAPLWGLCWAPDGTRLVTTDISGGVVIWDRTLKALERWRY